MAVLTNTFIDLVLYDKENDSVRNTVSYRIDRSEDNDAWVTYRKYANEVVEEVLITWDDEGDAHASWRFCWQHFNVLVSTLLAHGWDVLAS